MADDRETLRLQRLADLWSLKAPEDLERFLTEDPKTALDPQLREVWRLRFVRACPWLGPAVVAFVPDPIAGTANASLPPIPLSATATSKRKVRLKLKPKVRAKPVARKRPRA